MLMHNNISQHDGRVPSPDSALLGLHRELHPLDRMRQCATASPSPPIDSGRAGGATGAKSWGQRIRSHPSPCVHWMRMNDDATVGRTRDVAKSPDQTDVGTATRYSHLCPDKGSTDVTNRLPMRDMTLRLLSLLVDSIYNLDYWNPSRDIANWR